MPNYPRTAPTAPRHRRDVAADSPTTATYPYDDGIGTRLRTHRYGFHNAASRSADRWCPCSIVYGTLGDALADGGDTAKVGE